MFWELSSSSNVFLFFTANKICTGAVRLCDQASDCPGGGYCAFTSPPSCQGQDTWRLENLKKSIKTVHNKIAFLAAQLTYFLNRKQGCRIRMQFMWKLRILYFSKLIWVLIPRLRKSRSAILSPESWSWPDEAQINADPLRINAKPDSQA